MAPKRASFASTPAVRRKMQAQPQRDTAPELRLRRALHALGFRFRVHLAPVPAIRRRADIVFTRRRVAVFVDGCFWHGCPDHGVRAHKVNGWYWPEKILGNRRRDTDTDERLRAAGWTVVRVWEHVPVGDAVAMVEDALKNGDQLPEVRRPEQ